MEMRAQLSQQDLAFVHVGMPAQVTPVGSDRSFTGNVWQVAPMIDAQSRLGEVRIAVPYEPGHAAGRLRRSADHGRHDRPPRCCRRARC